MASEKPVFLPPERKANRQVFILIAILGAIGCALVILLGVFAWSLLPLMYQISPSQEPGVPVSENERFSFPMFSIGVPEGSGWTYKPLSNGISFESKETLNGDETGYGDRTTGAQAWYDAPYKDQNLSRKEFLEFACTYMGRIPEGKDYEEQEQTCDWWRNLSYDCVRLDARYAGPGSEDNLSSGHLTLDSHSLACRHPDFYNAVIFLRYAQWGPEGSIEENVTQQADAFFMGVGMNWPQRTQPAGFSYEMNGEIQTAEPGENLAYHKAVRVSMALSDFPAPMAVDGSETNWWSAGARPPQWIEIDLGQNYVVDEIRLLISQSPPGRTIHEILASGIASDHELMSIYTFDGVTADSQWLSFQPSESLRGVRYIRIETTYSPSWVGWREIEVIAGE